MPVVKQYGPSPQVAQKITATPRAVAPITHLEDSSAIGRNFINFGQSIDAMGKQMEQTAAEDALVKFEREQNKLMYDPNSGYMNLHGKDAYDAASETNRHLEKLKKTTLEGVKGARAQRALSKAIDAHIINTQRKVLAHSAKGLHEWQAGVTKARMSIANENAVNNWKNPLELRKHVAILDSTLNDNLDAQGMSDPKIRKASIKEAHESVAVAAVKTAASSSSAEGLKALNDYGDMLNESQKQQLKDKIERQMKADKSRTDSTYAISKADTMIQDFAGDPDNIDLAGAEKVINAIPDAKTRNAVRGQWLHRVNQVVSEKKAERSNTADLFVKTVMNGGSVASFIADHKDEWNDLKQTQKDALMAGKGVVSDPYVVNKLQTLPDAELAKIDINDDRFFGKLSPADRSSFSKMIKNAREGKGHFFARTKAKVISNLTTELFGKEKNWGKSKRERVGEFMVNMQREIDRATTDAGHELPPDELNKVVHEAVRPFLTDKGFFYDTTVDIGDVKLPELAAMNRVRLQIGDENAPLIADVRKEMNDRGIPVTYERLAKAVGDALKGGK